MRPLYQIDLSTYLSIATMILMVQRIQPYYTLILYLLTWEVPLQLCTPELVGEFDRQTDFHYEPILKGGCGVIQITSL